MSEVSWAPGEAPSRPVLEADIFPRNSLLRAISDRRPLYRSMADRRPTFHGCAGHL